MYLTQLGYANVELYKSADYYPSSRINNSILNGYPVIMSGIRWSPFKAHTWVIDGYIKQIRYGIKVGEKTGKVYGERHETREFIHCNWGWDGNHDGYFYPGVFDTSKPASYQENGEAPSGDKHYSYPIRIITYTINRDGK